MIATEIVVLATALFTCVTTVAASSCCAYICSRNHMYTIELLKGKKRQLVDLIDGLKQKENGDAVVTPELACFIDNVGVYLTQVKQTITEIDKGIDDKCMIGLLPNLWAQKQARTRMEKTFMELDSLIEEGEDMSRRPVKGYKQPREVDIVGKKRREASEEIWHQVAVSGAEQAVGVISIHGGVGVGKTSIAKYIHNKALNDIDSFDYVVWVNVQYGADQVWQVQEDISDSLEIDLSPQIQNSGDVAARAGLDETRRRAVVLRNHLLQKGKFLLVLDSMREPLMSLDEIGIPELVGGRKLILTSRTNTMCIKMERTTKYEMHALSNVDEAWELFKNEMGSSLPQNLEEETVSSIKRASLAELDGLPAVISKLAQILGNKQEHSEINNVWRKELDGLAMKPFNYMDLKGFKDSFEDLEEAIKPCFLYCALFPKNHIIESKELIEYWMWEGLLGEDIKTLEETMDKGMETLNKLKNSYLLQIQSGGERVKMLNLVRSMAIDTMGKKVCIRSGGFLTSLRPPSKHNNWNSDVERASFMENQLKDLKHMGGIVCHKLSTLFLQDNPLDSSLHDQFFDTTPNLRVIDLSRTLISILPPSLSQLRNLHALLLRNCPNLTNIPNLSNLQELIVLDISGTPIRDCPKGIQKMTKLRRLNLSQTRMDTFPANAIGTHLRELEELLMIMGDGGGCIWGSNELEEHSQGACIEDLLKLDNISVLEINFLNTHVFDTYIKKACQENKMPQKFRFCVGGFQSGRHVVGDNGITIIGSHRFTPPNTMLNLQLIRCSEKICVLELGKHSLSNLQVLYVSTLSGTSYLFSVEIFQSLDKLTELHVRNCKQMVALVKPDDTSNPSTIKLPRLMKVALFDLPKLNSICGNIELVCPALCSLDVSRCENLKHFHGLKINSKSCHVSLDTTNLDFQGSTLPREETPSKEASSSCCARIYSRKAEKYRMTRLKERKLALCNLIDIAKQKMEVAVATLDVPNFLIKAEENLREVNKLIMEVEKGRDEKFVSGLLPNVCAQKQVRTRMERMLVQLNSLIEEGEETVKKPVKGYEQPREVCIVGEKRRDIVEEIWKLLVGEEETEVGAICIHGVLGVGKTSIAKYIHNKALKSAWFDYVIWVSVEHGAGLQQVQDVIANSLDIDLNPTATGSCGGTIKGRARILRNALLERDRFLLVVDSIWQPLCLDDIGIPELVGGSKLMVTSRKRNVFNEIHASKKMFEVQPLSSLDESWELFKMEMGSYLAPCLEKDESISNNIKSVLLDQLDGLPLAISELADTYMSEDIIQEDSTQLKCPWRKELGSSLAKQPSFHMELRDTELFLRFTESFENLEEVARKCFLHATLLPKETVIQSKELIEYWMWEGLLGDNFETLEEGMKKGKQTLNELKNSHFLGSVTTQVSDHKVKMLNLFRSMAIETMNNNAGNLVFIRSAASLTCLPLDYEWPPEVEKASFTQNQISELRLTKKPKFNRLSTLLLQDNPLNMFYDHSFFYSMPNLRFLDMSRTCILVLPKSLSSLKNLHILILRNCANLTTLPDLSNLRDLVAFDLSGTPLEDFPLGIGNMKKLRRMDLSHTRLAKCPPGVVGELLELEELLMITKNGCKWGSHIHDDWVEACVEELVGLVKLSVLELHFVDVSSLDMYVKKAEECTNFPPKFRFCVGHLQNAGQNSVTISGSSIITLPNNTLELHMMMCDNKLKLRGGLRDLDVLDVSNCDGLLYLFSADILGSLKNLRILKVRSCEKMKKVVQPATKDCSAKIVLPALTTMVFFSLPNLESVCCGQVLDCPRLSLVQVWCCKELKLPMIIIGPNRPQIEIQGHASWFHSSCWDNPGNSNPLFQDTPHSNINLRFVEVPVPPELEATLNRDKEDEEEEKQKHKQEQGQGGDNNITRTGWRYFSMSKLPFTQ